MSDCKQIINSFINPADGISRLLLKLVALWLITSVITCHADNLIMNGLLDSEQSNFPPFWYTQTSTTTQYNRSGGPGGKGAVMLTGSANIRQGGFELVAGEKYKLSGMFKTRNFKPRVFMFVVHNSGWKAQVGITKIPENTGRWIKLEKVIKIMPSLHPAYGVGVVTADARGQLWVTDLKLEPLSDKAKALSKNPIATPTRLIIPWQPRLNFIPTDKPLMTFVTGKFPPPGESYKCRYQVDNQPEKDCDIPKNGTFTIELHNVPAGNHKLKTVLIEKHSGKKVAEENFGITLIEPPEIKTDQWKKQNNLVTELLSITDSSETEHIFYAPCDGWIHISNNSGTIKLDNITLPQLPEQFQQVKAGRHTIYRENNPAGKLTVVSVPEILTYQTFYQGNDFANRYALPNSNVTNQALGAKISPLYNKFGGIIVANRNIFKAPCTAEILRERLETFYNRFADKVNGIAADECFFTSPRAMGNYSRAIRSLKIPQDRLLYTWVVGKPTTILHTDFMASAINVSRGRGRLLCESYCNVHDTLAKERTYLQDILAGTMKKFRQLCPETETATDMVLGIFSRPGSYSLNTRPEVDFKCALDLEMNMLANHPEFRQLKGVGFWGLNYADEEIYRWAYALLRHYAIEGKKGMLSRKFGFKYNPGLLKNGDFTAKLRYWKTRGTVTAEKYSGLYTKIQKRWGNSNDTYALLSKKNNQTAVLQQSATGLTPDRLYALSFVTADMNEIRHNQIVIRKYGINVKISNAEIVKTTCLLDKRSTKNKKQPRLNIWKVVFRAKAPTTVIRFDNAKAANKEELLLNFVQLTPYFTEK